MGTASPEPVTPVVKRSLFSWLLLQSNRRRQVLLLSIVLVTVVARLIPIEMQKRIVDEGIMGRNADRLVIYSAIYLGAFLLASSLKYAINALQTIIGQKTLARMRREMLAHILRLPYGFFRNTQSGAVVTTLMTELATAGDFVGVALAVPATNILTLVAFGAYLFWLNPLLAAVSFSIYPVVVILIPRLQKRVNHFNRQRVNATREVSGKIGEMMTGLHEIKIGNAYAYEEDRFGRLVDRLCRIRIIWNLYRFAVKVANNLLTNFSRFLIFAVGGYLALNGHLAIGALVAFISAQEKLYDPWKELIQFYQAYQTASVTYDRAMQTFNDIPEATPKDEKPTVDDVKGKLELQQVGYRTATGARLLRDISLKMVAGEHLALVGSSGSGKSTLAHCIVGLVPPSDGRILLDGHAMSDLTRADISRHIAFVPQKPFVFKGTIAENIGYPLPVDWLDASDDEKRQQRDDCIEVLQQVGLFVDVLGFGLESTPRPGTSKALKSAIVSVRRRLSQSLPEELADHMERFDEDCFLYHASLGENLLFGRVRDDAAIDPRRLTAIPGIAARLAEAGLLEDLTSIGLQMVDGLAAYFQRPPLPEYIQRLLPLDVEKMQTCLDIRERVGRQGDIDRLHADEKDLLQVLALSYVPRQFDLVEIPEALREGIVSLRRDLRALLSRSMPEAVTFYRQDRYIEQIDILSNLLFGRITAKNDTIRQRIGEAINRTLIEKELLEAIVEIGLQHPVGTAGGNLSGGQQQKLAIARTFLKRPPVLVFDEATASLDNASQARVQDILGDHWKGRSTLIAVIHRLDVLPYYDRVAVMEAGRIVECGAYHELMSKKGLLYKLVTEGEAAPTGCDEEWTGSAAEKA
ncbi:MAG: ABC transporter ATP-binding protein [Desulfobacterales bacterium]|jgi:ABC-type multidrug transport system fused ATPase/permease subunit